MKRSALTFKWNEKRKNTKAEEFVMKNCFNEQLHVNKNLILAIGDRAALWITYMLSFQSYVEYKNQLDEEGYFYRKLTTIENELGYSYDIQAPIIKYLQKVNLLKVKRYGSPPRNFYKINLEGLASIYSSNEFQRLEKSISGDRKNQSSKMGFPQNKSNNIISNIKKEKLSKESLIVSDETNSPKKRPVKKRSKKKDKKPVTPHPLIDYWNTLEGVNRHLRTDTDTYKRAKSYIKLLKSGRMWRECRLDNEFIKRNKIPRRYLNGHKYTDREIKQAMKNISLLNHPDRFPAKKNKYPKALAELIYNPFTQPTSLFLMFLHKEPPLLSNIIKNELPDDHPGLTKILVEELTEGFDRMNNTQQRQMIQATKAMIDFHKQKLSADKYETEFGSSDKPWKFFKFYIDWLKDEFDFDSFHPSFIGPGSKTWPKFEKLLQEDYFIS